MTAFQDTWTNQQFVPVMSQPSALQMAAWDQGQPLSAVRRRRCAGFGGDPYAQTHQRRDVMAQLRELQRYYMVLGDDSAVTRLLETDQTLFALLSEAVQPLAAAFGKSLLRVRVQHADDESLIKVAVQLPAEFAEPGRALEAFDESWWINNCHRSAGALVFDYEFRNAL